MSMALLILHVFLSLGIITLVLLQKGAGASAGAAFGGGGGGAGSVFGASGSANFLSKMTAILATGFFVNSLALAYLAANRDVSVDSIIDSLGAPTTEFTMPAAPSETLPSELPPLDIPVEGQQGVVPEAEYDMPPPADISADEVGDIPPADEAVKE